MVAKLPIRFGEKLLTKGRARTKYGAKRATTPDGIEHHSRKEAKRWMELQLLEKAGEIDLLSRQEPFVLIGADGEPLRSDSGRPLKYVADFVYRDARAGYAEVIEDTKGFRTREYLLKKAILRAMNITIKEV